MKTKKTIPNKTLSEDQWNFFPKGSQLPPTWQWNHWLNYEYARESMVIRTAVEKIRGYTIPKREAGTYPATRDLPRFATYLARIYPDFPHKPWLKLPKELRAHRVTESGVNRFSNPFEKNTLKVYDTLFFAQQLLIGEINLSPGKIPDETIAVLEIDYTQCNELIVRKFQEWLLIRRKELQKMFEKIGHPNVVKEARNRMNVGQRGNKRIFKKFFKQLGALRLMNLHSDEYIHCWEETREESGCPLYTDEMTSWQRSKKGALDLLSRFEKAWQYHYFPPFILQPNNYSETILADSLGRPFTTKKKKQISRPTS